MLACAYHRTRVLAYHHKWLTLFEPLFVFLPSHKSISFFSVTFHFSYPCYLPDLLQPDSLLCLLCSLCCTVVLWTYGWVGLKGKVCVSVSCTQSLSTIPRPRQQAREHCSSAPLLPLSCPRCGRCHKPNGRTLPCRVPRFGQRAVRILRLVYSVSSTLNLQF